MSDQRWTQDKIFCPVLLPTFVLACGRTGQKPKTRPVLQDRTPGLHVLCSALMNIFFPVLLPTFVLAGGRTGQKPKTRPVLQDRTPGPPVLCSARYFGFFSNIFTMVNWTVSRVISYNDWNIDLKIECFWFISF